MTHDFCVPGRLQYGAVLHTAEEGRRPSSDTKSFGEIS